MNKSIQLENTDTVEYYLKCLKHKCHPVLDETKESLLNNELVIDLLKDCWYEAMSIGRSLGYEDGWEHGNEDYYNGAYS